MWKLTIEDDEGKQTGLPLAHDEYALGRGESNSIRLTDRNVSRRHATLTKNGQGWVIRDLDSYNGTFVNGVRVNGEQHLRHGDLVQLGDYRIEIVDEALLSSPNPAPAPGSRPSMSLPLHARPNRLVMVVGPTPGAEFPLEGERFTIGRSEDATISINHSSVSRLHADLISLGNGRYEVVDRQSANGVRINGVELKRGLLEAGDALELGDVRLRFVAAGKIFRAGPDGVANAGGAPGSYDGVASPTMATAQASPARAGKLIMLLVAAFVLVAIAAVAFVRIRSRPRALAPEAPPVIAESASGDEQILRSVREPFSAGHVDAAHSALQAIPETAPIRETQAFKDLERQVETRWAEEMFRKVERAETKAEKLMLLNEIAKTTSVPMSLRGRVADMRQQIDPEGPAEQRPSTTPDAVAPSSHVGASPSQPASAAGTRTAAAASSAASATSSAAASATSSAEAPLQAQPGAVLDSSAYPEQRRLLEPKVWSGKASIDEIRLLRAICSHQGDASCRDRAGALLQKRQR